MPWRLILLLYGAVVSAAAEGFSYQNGCKVRPSITAVLRSGSTLDFEAFVSSQAVTITIPQPGKMIKIFLSNKTPLLTAPGYSKVSPVLLRGWKRFKIEVDWRFLMVEKGGALVVGEQENRQLGLDLVSDVRVVISGSALMGNCERGGPVWDIYNEGVTTVTIFNEDFSDKNFTIFSSDFFIVHLEICSEGFVLTGHRRFDFTLQFDRVKMTVTPVILRPRFQRLHDPIFCHERYIDLRFSPRIADPILTLTLNRSNSEVKGDHVSTRPFWMPSGTTDERGFSAGDERVTSSHTKHLGDLDSGSSNASGTSSDTKHLGDLDSGSSNATGTSSHTNHTENLPSSPSANPVTTEDTTFDPRGPTFPVVTILSGEQVTTPRVLPEGGGNHTTDITLSEMITLIAMVITLTACMTAVFCIRYYLGYFRIRCRRRQSWKTTLIRHASPAPSVASSNDSDGYIKLDDLPKRPLPRPPCPLPRATQTPVAEVPPSSCTSSFSVVSSSSTSSSASFSVVSSSSTSSSASFSVVSPSSSSSLSCSSFPPSSSRRPANGAARRTRDSSSTRFTTAPANHPTSDPINHPITRPISHADSLRVISSQDSTSSVDFPARDSTAQQTDAIYEEIHIYVDIEGERLYSNVPAGGGSAEKTG
ncbi:mucin-3A-like isoform X1 [Penaeus vannamei]|uniref:mucin-3A-like isoform X1 n=1 Tax=Penaeus vannamei TaxID=6689 RepID=UPI00387FA644